MFLSRMLSSNGRAYLRSIYRRTTHHPSILLLLFLFIIVSGSSPYDVTSVDLPYRGLFASGIVQYHGREYESSAFVSDPSESKGRIKSGPPRVWTAPAAFGPLSASRFSASTIQLPITYQLINPPILSTGRKTCERLHFVLCHHDEVSLCASICLIDHLLRFAPFAA